MLFIPVAKRRDDGGSDYWNLHFFWLSDARNIRRIVVLKFGNTILQKIYLVKEVSISYYPADISKFQ